MAATTGYDPAVLSMFDALCRADINTKELVYQLESALNPIIGSNTDDFDVWEDNLRDEIERESMASEIGTLNNLRSTYLYVQGTDAIPRLNSRSLQLRQVRDRFATKCNELLVALDRTLPELTDSPDTVILSVQRQELLFIQEQFLCRTDRLFGQADHVMARLKFFDVSEERFEAMLRSLTDRHGLTTQLRDLMGNHFSTLRRLFEERRMIVDESSYIIETAYRTWFHETVSEQDRQQSLDTVCALQSRIRQQFSLQKEAFCKIDHYREAVIAAPIMLVVQESEWWTTVEVLDMIECFDQCLHVIMDMEDMCEDHEFMEEQLNSMLQ